MSNFLVRNKLIFGFAKIFKGPEKQQASEAKEDGTKSNNQQAIQPHSVASQHSATRQHSTAGHSTGRRTPQDTAPTHQTTGKGGRTTPSKGEHTAQPNSTAPHDNKAPQSTTRRSTTPRHTTPRDRAAPPHHRTPRETAPHTAAHHSARLQRQHRPNRRRTARTTEHNTAPPTREKNTNQHRQRSKTDSRAPRHGTKRQDSTVEHRTQHRGAGRRNTPQHTAGQQATRPGKSTRDKKRQRETTADNQTQ